jgi:hypothetical protein
MDQDLLHAASRLTERIVALSVQHDAVRHVLRAIATAVLSATEGEVLRVTPESDLQVADGEQRDHPAPSLFSSIEDNPIITPLNPDASPRALPLPALILGTSRSLEPYTRNETPHVEVRTTTTDDELPAIETHCRLKAEGIRWAATRRRRMEEGADTRCEIAPRDREILDRARDQDCYLWMNTPSFVVPNKSATLEDLAGCFEAVAEAVALVRKMLPNRDAKREWFEPALDLLAEAQSALRVAIDRIEDVRDQDQFKVYSWLRGVAARDQIYIRRYMRLDDPADPAILPDIVARIGVLDAKFEEAEKKAKRRTSHLNRLRYHSKLIREGNGTEHDWRKVAGAIDDLVSDGIPVSSVLLLEVLLPIHADLPELDELPQRFVLVLREIDRYLAGRISPQEVGAPAVLTSEVVEAARLLSGRSVVLIGGIRHPDSHEMLKASLKLQDLVWIETREHESIDKFEPFIARPDVALVLLAIRWSSHSFGDVKRFCDRYGKPMARLPGGYNPNQVAAQILSQCSEQLTNKQNG